MWDTKVICVLAYFCCGLVLFFFLFVAWWLFRDEIKAWFCRKVNAIAKLIDSIFDMLLRITLGKEEQERNLP